MNATLTADDGPAPAAQALPRKVPFALGPRPFVVVFLLWWIITTAWALATPLWGSPDEYQHAYRAYAAARGEVVISPQAATLGTGGFVDGPSGWTSSIRSLRCYAFKAARTANCLAPITNDATPKRVASTAARYNPVYYLFVGSASLLTGPARAPWAMRVASGLLSALFLAAAFTSAATSRRPGLSTSAVVLASTPMVAFLAGSINPNGLEITAAMSGWVNGYLMFSTQDDLLRQRYLRRAALAMMGVLVTRGLSPLWVVVIGFILLLVAGNRQHVLRLWQAGRGWWAAIAVTGLASVAWTILDKTLVLNVNPHPSTYNFDQRLHLAWGSRHKHLFLWRGTIGTFGWLDTNMPLSTVQLWTVVVVLLAVLALVVTGWRGRLGLLTLGVAVLSLPALLEAQNWNVSGPVWQPRYTMPISLGVVLLAGLLLAESRRWERARPLQVLLGVAFCLTATWTNVCGFVVAISRYAVGARGAISLSGKWHPPVSGVLLVVVVVLAWLLLGAIAVGSSFGRLSHQPVDETGLDEPPLDDASDEHPAAV